LASCDFHAWIAFLAIAPSAKMPGISRISTMGSSPAT
jgi:hypothetical protein